MGTRPIRPDGVEKVTGQGQFMIRAYCAKLLGIDMANIRVTPAEIGGGFGGKTLIYFKPVALVLSRKTGRAVKMVMTCEEVFRATGPTSGGVTEVKLDPSLSLILHRSLGRPGTAGPPKKRKRQESNLPRTPGALQRV